VGRKRRPTPTSTTNLRRSKRKIVVNDGFKPVSPAVTRSKNVVRKKAIVSTLGKRSSLSITPTEFPDLSIIDKFMNEVLSHPHIPIPELQRVAKEVCRIPPLEVTQELLV
jgi:hypothetical protein